MKETSLALKNILVWVVCWAFFFFLLCFPPSPAQLLMFPFKEKEEKRHLVEAFCKLLIHKARRISPAASLEY